MTPKQQRFCEEYLIDLNATQAAIRAGYSANYANTNAPKLLQNTAIREYLEQRMKAKQNALIAQQDEVLQYLTSVMRGESECEQLVQQVGTDGKVEVQRIPKHPEEKDRLRAAELLGKRYALYTDNVAASVQPSEKFADIVKQLKKQG